MTKGHDRMSSPFVLQLNNKPCLVIGGGKIAERKINHLIAEKAAVTVISPTLTDHLNQQTNDFTYMKTSLVESDLKQETCERLGLTWRSFFLVVVATEVTPLNEMFAKYLNKYVVLINVVDSQVLSSFFFPAVLDRGHLKIAITTSGASPILAKKIKHHLLEMFGPEYRDYTEYLANIRADLHESEPDAKKRKQILEDITEFPAPKKFD
ncbi:bifunctional precorrin-2 dehydrogenase/sirohydrochlorin ferrochelatase [Salipaludibacillus sp. HK11]|uniref:precorrin-2 dehydrogenase/sirohydrochlorin ferrochelatase family protein n=1 Tax=Salipaludibacillus sp. HK11 TaxID=3394320 RepID=UPI0039FC12A9